jgi:hypothetical protein
MELVSPGTTATLPGKRSKGNLSSVSVRLNAFEESLQSMQDRILRHGNDVMETLFKEQIAAARARSLVARSTNPSEARNRFAPENFRTIHDYYIEALLGRSKSSHPGSITGGFSRHVEGISDKLLAATTTPVAKAWAGVTERLGRHNFNPWDGSAKSRAEFDSLTEALGAHMPFKSTAELVEAKGFGAMPLTTARITGGLNRMTAALTLRFMEVAHPVLNLAGTVNAAPAIIRSMTPLAGETTEQFAKRIGHSATIFNLPDGRVFGVPDMTKIYGRAIKRAWNRTSHADYDHMVRRGYLTQEVAEFQRQFAALQAPGRYEAALNKLVERGSVLSDRSEDFSRSIGHMVGLELADILGIAGRDARHVFAHDVANKMIANYDPHNRAEIFQGAFGSTIGLFQSFAHNYYGRLFRYLETGDRRTFAIQQATQASLFGMNGLTGWAQMNDFVDWASDGERRPKIDLYGGSPEIVSSIVGNGLISQVPRIFGGEAVDFYSRGDTNVRLPGYSNGDFSAQAIPGLSAILKVADGFVNGISAFAQERTDLSVGRIAEIVSNMVVNRPVAGMIEVGLTGGRDVDSRGQVQTETQSALESAYRMIGLRSQRQSMEREAFYADKRSQEIQQGKKERLRLLTRSAIRNNEFDKLPQIYEQYVLTGGDPAYFRAWIKGNYEAATSTVAKRRLDDLLANPQNFADAMRFIDMGVGVEEEETGGDIATQEAREPQVDPALQPDESAPVGSPFGQ